MQPGPKKFNSDAARATLREHHREFEAMASTLAVPERLAENIRRLQALVGLSDIDCRILEFAVLIHNERLLEDLADHLGNLLSSKVCHVLSVILDLPEREVRAALSTKGILARSGLVAVGRQGAAVLRTKLDLLSEQFADVIASTDADPVSLLRDTVSLAAPPHLSLTDYAHLGASLDVLHPYLKKSVATARPGVNIFLHGEPGTGKSQLAKVLAKTLGCELFEVASEDTDGDAVDGAKRLILLRHVEKRLMRARLAMHSRLPSQLMPDAFGVVRAAVV